MKRILEEGDTGSQLYIYKEHAWWGANSLDTPREAWREGGYGSYLPVKQILLSTREHFPRLDIEDGCLIRVTVEVIRP